MEDDLCKLRDAAKAEYQGALQAARARYREALAHIDGVAKLRQRLDKPQSRRGRAPGFRTRNGLAAQIERALSSVTGPFTVRTIADAIREAGFDRELNRASLATAMRRLASDRDDIEVVQKGRGRREAVYEKRPDSIGVRAREGPNR